ncbi:MAG: ATP-binding protein, partial [Methanomicrobiales archaeon]|nr:ATP-binding protein [Methanomicrobiales archaeon]
LGEDVYLLVEAVPLGYIDSRGRFRKPRTLPAKFSPVEYPDSSDFRFLGQVMGDIEIGAMKSGQDVLSGVPVSLHARVLPQHMGVFATTGMGKSNFMKVFCASCMKTRQFGLLLVDPHGEYVAGGISSTGEPTKGLLHFTAGKGEGLAVFSTRPETERQKLHLNTLTLEYGDFRASDLFLLFEHSTPQAEVVETLEEIDGAELIAFFSETDFETFTPDSYAGPHTHIARQLGGFHTGTLKVIQRRIRILTGNNPFFRHRGSSLPEIIKALHANKVVVIDIPGMGERSELFVLSILTRTVLARHKKERGGWGTDSTGDRQQVLITIEEAQRVLSGGVRGTQVFRECAMEGRKFGIGLCVVTQQPKNIDARILAQINTFVVMGLGDRSDRAMIAGSAKQDLSAMDTEIQTLDQGEAIISTPGIPFPVSTRIHLFETYLAGLNKTSNAGIREGLASRF